MADKIILQIGLDTYEIDQDLSKFEQKAKKTGEKAGKNIGENLGLSFKNAVAGVAIGNILSGIFTETARKIKDGFSLMINEAIEDQDLVNKLNVSLASIGEYSKATSLDMVNLAQSMQEVTKFSDDIILAQLSISQSLGATASQSKEIVKASSDMATALGLDLNTAVEQLSKTLSGNVGLLGRSVPALKQLTIEQLKHGDAIKIVADRYAGFAEKDALTFSGSIEKLSNKIKDYAGELGEAIINSPAVIAGVKAITSAFNSLTLILKPETITNVINGVFNGLIIFARAINDFGIAPIELLWNVSKTAFSAIVDTINSFGNLTINLFAKIQQGIGAVYSAIGLDDLSKQMEKNAQVSKDIAESFSLGFENTAKNLDKVFDGTIYGKTEALIQRLEANKAIAESMASQIAEPKNSPRPKDDLYTEMGADATGPYDRYMEEQKKLAEHTKQISAQMASSWNNFAVKGISSGVQKMISNIQQGKNAFSDMAKMFMQMLGDMFIQMGETLLLAGIGIKSLFALDGSGAIFAGAGLIALGAILKSFTGGVGDSGPSGGSGGGVEYTSQSSNIGDDLAKSETKKPDTKVTVNVYGSIMDSHETGSRIVDLINTAYDKQGVVINKGAIA